MYEFKEMILPEHFNHASYAGFCVKPGMFYGVEKESGKLVATTGWNINGSTNIYIQHEPKSKWNNDLWEDLYDDYGKPLITIEKNDLQRISSKVKEFQRTAMDFETWAMEKNVEILMEDGCTGKEAEKHLNNGTAVYTLEDFTENFEFMKNFHEDADEIEADKKIKKMLETKIPMDGYSFVKYDGKEWLISYCL